MAITSEATLITALAAPSRALYAAPGVTAGNNQFVPLYRVWIQPNVVAATPSTSGAALDRTAPGALYIPGSGGGLTNYCTGWGWVQITATAGQLVMLYDRLVETGALDSTLTTAQTVNSAALPSRNSSGVNVELWFEIYATLGSTGMTATASYTNSSGASGRSATCVLPGSPRLNTAWPFTLQSGDIGIQSVQSITLSASTGTAGNFGCTLRQQIGPMIHFGVNNALSVESGWAEMGLAQIPADACVELVIMASSASTNGVHGWLHSAQG